jgi:two-component system response regulator NreC
MNTMITVLLVDDHPLLRAGLRMLLEAEPDLRVVGEAADGDEAVSQAEALRPDVVVMDLLMPRMDGLEATLRITAGGSAARVLVLTVTPGTELLMPALNAGAVGYLTKQAADRDLVHAIRAVARGDPFLPPGGLRMLAEMLRGGGLAGMRHDPVSLLSEREREVLKLTAEGYDSAGIGDRLGLSARTVDSYRQRLMGKLGLHHRSEAVHFALEHGLLVPAAA